MTKDLFANKPLVNQLVARYEQCASLIYEARARRIGTDATTSLEEFLAQYAAREGADDQRAVLATKFFLRDLLWACGDMTTHPLVAGPVTNYVGLLGLLNRWADYVGQPLVCVTFNYDRLLEQAARSVWNFRPTSLAGYVARRDRPIIKLHGSVDWAIPLTRANGTRPTAPDRISAATGVIQHRGPISSKTTLIYAGDHLRADEPVKLRGFLPKSGYRAPWTIPHLALPTEGKPEAICPPEHLDAIREAVRDSPGPLRLLTVGWRGAEDYFLDMLAEMFLWKESHRPPTRCLFVTGDEPSAQGLIDTLNSRVDWNWADDDVFSKKTNGFSNLVPSLELSRFLAD